jgi:hypothetical protein
MSLAVFALIAALSCGALMAVNRQAVVNRLYTLAQEMARDQIDRIQSVTPYNPQLPPPAGPQIPAELILDSDRGGPLVQTLPLYVDPANGNVVVTARMTVSITNPGVFNARAASVVVDFDFRGRFYRVQMNTLRTSDS